MAIHLILITILTKTLKPLPNYIFCFNNNQFRAQTQVRHFYQSSCSSFVILLQNIHIGILELVGNLLLEVK